VEGVHVEAIKLLLQNGALVGDGIEQSSRQSLLEICATAGHGDFSSQQGEVFTFLFHQGAQIREPRVRSLRYWNSTLTSLIIRSANHHIFQLALDAGADVDAPGGGKGARTPMQAAAEVGNLNFVKALFSKGAVINAPASVLGGRTALQAACSSEITDLELVHFLMDNGADVKAEAAIDSGLTTVQGAAIRGHTKLAILLLKAGADVNADPSPIEGRMALDGAAEHGRLDMAQILLNDGARSKWRERSGLDRAQKLANENGHYAVAELIRDHARGP
jgi:ankyrin repeat protein